MVYFLNGLAIPDMKNMALIIKSETLDYIYCTGTEREREKKNPLEEMVAESEWAKELKVYLQNRNKETRENSWLRRFLGQMLSSFSFEFKQKEMVSCEMAATDRIQYLVL